MVDGTFWGEGYGGGGCPCLKKKKKPLKLAMNVLRWISLRDSNKYYQVLPHPVGKGFHSAEGTTQGRR